MRNTLETRRKRKQSLTPWHHIMFLITAIFFYIWQQGLTINLGYRIQEIETKYKEFLAENRQLQVQALSLKSADSIRNRIDAFGLPLVEPKVWNVYYLNSTTPHLQ